MEHIWNYRKKRNSALDRVLGLSPRAATVRTVSVARELHNISLFETEDFLEATTDGLEHFLALGRRAAVLVSGDALADGPRPQADTVEALAHVHDDTHHLVVTIVLEGLANGGQLGVEPEIVDRYGALVFERVGPLATVLVLGVFPLGTDALLEEMVVGFQAQFRGRCDVVLET